MFAKLAFLMALIPFAAFGAGPAKAAPSVDKTCVDLHVGLGFDGDTAGKRCGWKERREIIRTDAFAKCRKAVEAASRDATIPLICFSADVAKAIAAKPSLAPCVAASTIPLNNGFWYQEDFVLAGYYQREVAPAKIAKKKASDKKIPDQPGPTFFQDRVLAACSAPPLVQPAVGARVLGQMHIHTYAPQRGGEGPIGGFSDIVADSKGSLMAVSDDLQRPSLGFFEWAWSADGDVMELKYRANRSLLNQQLVAASEKQGEPAKPLIDFEAMDVLPNGDLVLATEISPKLTGVEVAYESSYLMRVGSDGAWREGIPLRSEFIPYFDKRDVKCTRLHRLKKKSCVEYFQVAGFEHNKGIEALTLNGKKTHLVYVTEQPLFDPSAPKKTPDELEAEKKDRKPEPPKNGNLLLTAQSLTDATELTTYVYPLSLDHDNGVVALRHYRDRTYLALERGYDSELGEALVRIYRVELPKAAGQAVRKTLVLDVAALKPSFTRGFDSVDNFEGLAIGPVTERGTVLFLVSDNNFNVAQRTMLLALEISKELLP